MKIFKTTSCCLRNEILASFVGNQGTLYGFYSKTMNFKLLYEV